jgi:hypothetical protein
MQEKGSSMEWQDRCEIHEDVVFFRYSNEGIEKHADEVFVWDLDKTYLDTAMDSLSQLLNTIFERSSHKKNIPGTQTLLQVLAEDWTKQKGQLRFPVFFITASPPQMETRISEKFALDGLHPLGVFYKDNLRNLTPKRFWRLTKQVGYKVQALLQLRLRLKENVRQICWGDDSESDAIIYNLYSDLCSRRRNSSELRQIMKALSVPGEQIEAIFQLQSQIPENDPVEKIYINLATDTDPDYYQKFGRRTVPTYNAFQIALDLHQDHRLDSESIWKVAMDMMMNFGFSPEELQKGFDDLIRRRVLGAQYVAQAMPFFVEKGIFARSYVPSIAPAKETNVDHGRVFELEGQFEPWVPDHIDYLHDYR